MQDKEVENEDNQITHKLVYDSNQMIKKSVWGGAVNAFRFTKIAVQTHFNTDGNILDRNQNTVRD